LPLGVGMDGILLRQAYGATGFMGPMGLMGKPPNAKRQTPNAGRQTPNAKRQTPNAVRHLIIKSGQYPIAFAWRA
jgi:hypothetical protein